MIIPFLYGVIFTAALILVLFYVIGRFVADLVASILTSIGFDNIFGWLGLPPIVTPVVTPPFPQDILAEEEVASRQALTPPLPSRRAAQLDGASSPHAPDGLRWSPFFGQMVKLGSPL